MLELSDIHKVFIHQGETIKVFQGVDLFVNKGESIAIIGASGVGKSTLLNIMGSLERPTHGVVNFAGRNIYKMRGEQLCRLRNNEIGFVFQFHHLLPELNSLENVMMPALISRYSAGQAADMAREMLGKVGLEKRLKHRPGELSGGERQRVAIARSLIMGPKLVLADEPTGNLDWARGEKIAELLIGLTKGEDLALVVATHNLKLADKMSKQMEIISGKVQQHE